MSIAHTLSRTVKQKLRRLIAPSVALLVMVYFAFYSLQGTHGVIAAMRLSGQIEMAQALEAKYKAIREEKQLRANRLRGPEIDQDLLEEQVRSVLGYARPGELALTGDAAAPVHRTAAAH